MLLKNTSDREWTINGLGKFAPGEAKEVSDAIAYEFKNYPGWKVVEKKAGKDKKEEAE